jgi:hypothetical protein
MRKGVDAVKGPSGASARTPTARTRLPTGVGSAGDVGCRVATSGLEVEEAPDAR